MNSHVLAQTTEGFAAPLHESMFMSSIPSNSLEKLDKQIHWLVVAAGDFPVAVVVVGDILKSRWLYQHSKMRGCHIVPLDSLLTS